MDRWEKLVNSDESGLRRGYLIRFSANQPFEGVVVMMVCGDPEKNRYSGKGLITITGHKAGINPFIVFPDECGDENVQISTKWLIANWSKWVWPDGDVNDVWIREPLNASEL